MNTISMSRGLGNQVAVQSENRYVFQHEVDNMIYGFQRQLSSPVTSSTPPQGSNEPITSPTPPQWSNEPTLSDYEVLPSIGYEFLDIRYEFLEHGNGDEASPTPSRRPAYVNEQSPDALGQYVNEEIAIWKSFLLYYINIVGDLFACCSRESLDGELEYRVASQPNSPGILDLGIKGKLNELKVEFELTGKLQLKNAEYTTKEYNFAVQVTKKVPIKDEKHYLAALEYVGFPPEKGYQILQDIVNGNCNAVDN